MFLIWNGNDLLNYYNNCKTLESQQSFMNTNNNYRKNCPNSIEIFNKSSEETQKWMIDGLIQQLNKNDYEKIPAKTYSYKLYLMGTNHYLYKQSS